MASIRNITVGNSTLKWDTGVIRSMYYNPDDIEVMFRKNIKPNIKLDDQYKIKTVVYHLVEKLMAEENFGMHQFCTLIVALRETEIDTTEKNEDGNFIVRRVTYKDDDYHKRHEKMTYYNVCYHMNHHCKQLWQCCFVRAIYPGWYGGIETKNLAFTTGEWKDTASSTFLDDYDEYARERRNKTAKKYY